MSVADILKSAKFVVDDKGNKKAVVFDFAIWDEFLDLLEDLEDAEEVRQLRGVKEETIPWEQAREELRSAGLDV